MSSLLMGMDIDTEIDQCLKCGGLFEASEEPEESSTCDHCGISWDSEEYWKLYSSELDENERGRARFRGSEYG